MKSFRFLLTVGAILLAADAVADEVTITSEKFGYELILSSPAKISYETSETGVVKATSLGEIKVVCDGIEKGTYNQFARAFGDFPKGNTVAANANGNTVLVFGKDPFKNTDSLNQEVKKVLSKYLGLSEPEKITHYVGLAVAARGGRSEIFNIPTDERAVAASTKNTLVIAGVNGSIIYTTAGEIEMGTFKLTHTLETE